MQTRFARIALLTGAAVVAIAARAGADDNTQAITEALGKLDHTNNDHWTADGLPRIDAMKSLTGDTSITRDMLEAARPGYNREIAGGENRVGNGMPAGAQPAAPSVTDGAAGAEPAAPGAGGPDMSAAEADGWVKHPDADGFYYKGTDVKPTNDVAAMYTDAGGVTNESNGLGQSVHEQTDPSKDVALDISGQTGQGGAETARGPAPVEGELRKTEVDELSIGAPGERPIGMTMGVTDTGVNQLGTPEGPVENAGRAIELSGEVAARNAGSVLTPSQAPAASDTPGSSISLGGAADPMVEARAPGGAAVMEGADLAETFEGPTAGGPFADGASASQLAPVGDVDYDGDPDEVNALEAELEASDAKAAELRQQIDQLSGELHTVLRTSAQLRDRIVAATPRSANMSTIRTFLDASHAERTEAVEKRNAVIDSLGGKEAAGRLLKL